MKNIYIVLGCFLLIGCHPKPKETLLFDNVYFNNLQNEEIITELNNVHQDYQQLIKDKKIQIPLYRAIKAEEYTIYIGFPYQTNLQSLSQRPLFDAKIINQYDTTDMTYKAYQLDSMYVTEFSRKINQNFIYILAKTKSDSIQNTVLNTEKLVSRIILSQ